MPSFSYGSPKTRLTVDVIARLRDDVLNVHRLLPSVAHPILRVVASRRSWPDSSSLELLQALALLGGDTAGHRSLSQLRRALTPRGTLVIVGSEVRGRWLGGFDRNLRAVALSRLVCQRLRMLGSKPRQQDLQTLGELIEAGKLTPVIDRTYPLREVPRPSGIWWRATAAAAR